MNITMKQFASLSDDEKTALLAELVQKANEPKAEPKTPKKPRVSHHSPKGDKGSPGMSLWIPSPGGFEYRIKLNKAEKDQPLTEDEKAYLVATAEALVDIAAS